MIVTQDARTAIDTLFGEPLRDRWARRLRRRLEGEQCMFLSLGLDTDLSGRPKTMMFRLRTPLEAAGKSYPVVTLYNYSGDPDYAPEGQSVVTCILDGDSYGFWNSARSDGSYNALKRKVLADFTEMLAEVLPETRGRVIASDLATPVTYSRYCGTYRGSWMSMWRPFAFPPHAPTVYRRVKGVYFAGQRVLFSGGLPPAAMSARLAVQHVCRDFSLEFRPE